jgi:hypothetical protein
MAANQKHDTEEAVETEDFGVCVAGKNSPQAGKILVGSSTEEPFGKLRAGSGNRGKAGIGVVRRGKKLLTPS